MRRLLLILFVVLATAAALLYTFLDFATATLLLFAGLVVSGCASATTLLGAYTRNKDIQRERDRNP